jgi:serine-type D-Ala-D-Ala endopeptidase (penicillin-binding protein 7)
VNSFFKKIVLLSVTLSLIALPYEVLAAKKSHKRVYTSQKKHYVKVSARTRAKMRAQQLHIQRQNAIDLGEYYDGSGVLQLASSKALIINQNTGEVVYAKNTNSPSPIASITKLMTAMVMLDAKQSLDESIYVTNQDVDYVKGTSSRLPVGASLSRTDMLQLALMASENRAASALASNYPGGQSAFVRAMNAKAQLLGLTNTHFVDPTGLESENVSTAEDLAKMVQAAYQYPEIRFATTSPSHEVHIGAREYPVNFNNTNGLVRAGEWEIGLSKTGYISEAGRCLVMQAKLVGEPMIIVLLDSSGKLTRIGDANRIRKWMEHNSTTTTGQTNTNEPTLVMAEKIS